MPVAPELSFCVVNTNQRELLLRCLDAIAAERDELPFASDVFVLDNASNDGSAGAARRHPVVTEVLALKQRRGWSENINRLAAASTGHFVVLLNEDAELQPGAVMRLYDALRDDPRAAIAAARLHRPDGRQQPSAWRFPSPLTALATTLNVHRRTVVQSRGTRTRRVDWAQSCAILIRRDAADAVDWWDEDFFVYSDEVDAQRRLADAGWHTLYVPEAVAIHHEQLSTGAVPERRIVEFSRNRDRYMRKHHTPAAAFAVRWITALSYALRAAAALVVPGHDPRRYWRHVTATLHPERGEGLREAAHDFNRGGPTL